MSEYYSAMVGLGRRMMALFARSLDLPAYVARALCRKCKPTASQLLQRLLRAFIVKTHGNSAIAALPTAGARHIAARTHSLLPLSLRAEAASSPGPAGIHKATWLRRAHGLRLLHFTCTGPDRWLASSQLVRAVGGGATHPWLIRRQHWRHDVQVGACSLPLDALPCRRRLRCRARVTANLSQTSFL